MELIAIGCHLKIISGITDWILRYVANCFKSKQITIMISRNFTLWHLYFFNWCVYKIPQTLLNTFNHAMYSNIIQSGIFYLIIQINLSVYLFYHFPSIAEEILLHSFIFFPGALKLQKLNLFFSRLKKLI